MLDLSVCQYGKIMNTCIIPQEVMSYYGEIYYAVSDMFVAIGQSRKGLQTSIITLVTARGFNRCIRDICVRELCSIMQ